MRVGHAKVHARVRGTRSEAGLRPTRWCCNPQILDSRYPVSADTLLSGRVSRCQNHLNAAMHLPCADGGSSASPSAVSTSRPDRDGSSVEMSEPGSGADEEDDTVLHWSCHVEGQKMLGGLKKWRLSDWYG